MWWIFSLISAGAQVFRNSVMKDLGHKMDEFINVWGRFTFILPFALAASYLAGFPYLSKGFWIYSFCSGLLVFISTLFLSKALKLSDISIVSALWKISVVFMLILGLIFLNEKVTYLSVFAILLTLFGVYFLNVKKAKISLIEPLAMLLRDKGLRYAVLAGLTLAPAQIFFKKTILHSDVFFPVFTNFLFASLLMLPIVLLKSRKHFKKIPKHSASFVLMGFLASVGTITSNAGYALASAAVYVEAVKQIEILFALGAGMLFFNERERVKDIWGGCLIIACGIILLIFSG